MSIVKSTMKHLHVNWSKHNRNKIGTYGNFQATIHNLPSHYQTHSSNCSCTNQFFGPVYNLSFVAYPYDISVEENHERDFRLALEYQDYYQDYKKSDSSNSISNSYDLPNDSNYYYFVITTSSQNNDGKNEIYAIYQILDHIKSGISTCPSSSSGHSEFSHHLEIQRAHRKIRIREFSQIALQHSNCYILKMHQSLCHFTTSVTTGSRFCCEFEVVLETRFEFDLMIKSLQAVSALTFMMKREKLKALKKKQQLYSGIKITVKKIESSDSSINCYTIVDCSGDVFGKRKQSCNVRGKVNFKENKLLKRGQNDTICTTKESIEDESFDNFYFVTSHEKKLLTDYMFVLISQVRRGRLTSKDRDYSRRKNSILSNGYLGMRCRNCNGIDRGHYFPTTSKNLQACPSMIFKHLMSCNQCPQTIKQLLKVLKTKHKIQVGERGSGSQISFYNKLWQRIHDEKFSGGDEDSAFDILKIIDDLCLKNLDNNETLTSFHQIVKQGQEARSPIKSSPAKLIENQRHQCLTFQDISNLKSPSPLNTFFDDDETIAKVSDYDDGKSCQTINTKEIVPNPLDLSPIKLSSQQYEKNEETTLVAVKRESKHVNQFKFMTYPIDPPPIPDISMGPSRSQIQSMFESQSLNVTLDMLDTFAGEILNSASYPLRFGKRKFKTSSTNDLDYQWDQDSLNVIKNMVKCDNDYREMIEYLAQMKTSD